MCVFFDVQTSDIRLLLLFEVDSSDAFNIFANLSLDDHGSFRVGFSDFLIRCSREGVDAGPRKRLDLCWSPHLVHESHFTNIISFLEDFHYVANIRSGVQYDCTASAAYKARPFCALALRAIGRSK